MGQLQSANRAGNADGFVAGRDRLVDERIGAARGRRGLAILDARRLAAPSPGQTIMNPPPPMLPASGNVTAIASAVATAASTALPPLAKIAAPTSAAAGDTHTTIPVVDSTFVGVDHGASARDVVGRQR